MPGGKQGAAHWHKSEANADESIHILLSIFVTFLFDIVQILEIQSKN